jgi:hypothetical protein
VQDLSIVVRSVGERTESACLRAVESQVDNARAVRVVRHKPFAQAHMESLRLAIESNAKWSLFLDADILLRAGAIANMIREAEQVSAAFYMLEFRVLDKGFGGPAYAGVHLYTTRFLAAAYAYKELASDAQRPETRLCQEMARRAGIPSLLSVQLLGLHGYEQYYRDLYRTTFVRAVKFARHREYLIRRYRERYGGNAEQNGDYKVMLWGAIDGMLYGSSQGKASLDAREYRARADQVMALLGFSEKEGFSGSQREIDTTIDHFLPDTLYEANKDRICSTSRVFAAVPDGSITRRLKGALRGRLLALGARIKGVLTDVLGE